MPEEIRVFTRVDLSGLQVGMNQGAAIVESATGRMSQAFKQVTVHSLSAAQTFSFFGQSSGTIGGVVVPLNKMGEAAGASAHEVKEARHAIHGLGTLTGVHMPRMVRNWVTSLEGVAPVMAMAFTPIMVISFVRILAEIPEAIEKGINKLHGWDEAAKKAFEKNTEDLVKAKRELIDYTIAYEKLNLIGKEGSGKAFAELATTQKDLDAVTAAIVEAYDRINEAESVVERAKNAPIYPFVQTSVGATVPMYSGKKQQEAELKWMRGQAEGTPPARDVEKAEATLKIWREHLDGLKKKYQELDLEAHRAGKEAPLAALEEEETAGAARAAAHRDVSLAIVAAKEKEAQSRLALGQITMAQELTIERETANERLRIEEEFIERQKAAAEDKARRTGKPATAEVVKLDAELQKARLDNTARLGELDRKAQQDAQSMAAATAKARIANAQKQADVETNIAVEASAAQLELHKITEAQHTQNLLAAEDTRWAAQRSALQAELLFASEFPEKNAAEIERVQGELATAEREHVGKLSSIWSDAEKVATEHARTIVDIEYESESERAKKTLEARRAEIEQAYSLDLLSARQRIAALAQVEKAEYELAMAASLRRYQQAAADNDEEGMAKAAADAAAIELDHQNAVRKLHQETGNDLVKHWNERFKLISGTMNTAINGWIQGTQTFGQAWARMAQGMVTNWAVSLAQMALKWAQHQAMKLILHTATTEAQVGVTAAGHAQETAISGKEALKKLSHTAAVAAGKAYESFAAVPIVGPALGAAAAGVTFGAIMAFGAMMSFGKGGIVPETNLALVHKNEMVLPENVSRYIQNSVSSGATSARSGDVHAHWHAAPGDTPASVWAKEKEFKRMAQKTLRPFLPAGS